MAACIGIRRHTGNPPSTKHNGFCGLLFARDAEPTDTAHILKYLILSYRYQKRRINYSLRDDLNIYNND